MKSEKQAALDLIRELPDAVSTETIVAELEFKLLIQRRLEQAERGEVVEQDEAERRLARWLDSAGR
jgi:predicted transcriptional regulator